MNLLFDRVHLLMMAEMYHSALKKEEEESERLSNKLEITSDLLKSTQRFHQESKLQICHFQKELNVSTPFMLHGRKFFGFNGGISCGGQP